jgi:preprotein translocase subunit SecG
MLSTILMLLLALTAVFLILLVLIQRGKGGGLSGAFGGMGGQSAFGTKAGDTFTKITVGVSSFWIVLCLVTVAVLSTKQDKLQPNDSAAPAAQTQGQAASDANPESDDGQKAPAQKAPAQKAPAPTAEEPAGDQSNPGSEQ